MWSKSGSGSSSTKSIKSESTWVQQSGSEEAIFEPIPVWIIIRGYTLAYLMEILKIVIEVFIKLYASFYHSLIIWLNASKKILGFRVLGIVGFHKYF